MGTRDSKTLQEVAQLAGVSASTVSRVINAVPGIAPATAENVRKAIASLNFSPAPRRRDLTRPSMALKGAKVAFAVLGRGASLGMPFYGQLLRGITVASDAQQIDLRTYFFDDVDEAVAKLATNRMSGLLLYGVCPRPDRAGPLRSLPAVWLMGSRKPPSWGDQIMPDNVAIGQFAAQYLLQNGHRNVMYFGLRMGWSLTIRALAFQQTMEDAGATINVVEYPIAESDSWQSDEFYESVHDFAKRLLAMPKRPTGIFVGEDWLLPRLQAMLEREGLTIGRGKDIEFVSCNNDTTKLVGIQPQPANIDLRIESIGQRAVDHLGWRMLRREACDRLRIMIEPILIPPPRG